MAFVHDTLAPGWVRVWVGFRAAWQTGMRRSRVLNGAVLREQ